MYDVFLLKILKPYGEEVKRKINIICREISVGCILIVAFCRKPCKERVPILERLSFLGIYSNNLDEVFQSTCSYSKPGWPSAKIKRRILNGKKH